MPLGFSTTSSHSRASICYTEEKSWLLCFWVQLHSPRTRKKLTVHSSKIGEKASQKCKPAGSQMSTRESTWKGLDCHSASSGWSLGKEAELLSRYKQHYPVLFRKGRAIFHNLKVKICLCFSPWLVFYLQSYQLWGSLHLLSLTVLGKCLLWPWFVHTHLLRGFLVSTVKW